MIVAETVLGCSRPTARLPDVRDGIGAGRAHRSGALVQAAAAVAQLLLRASGQAGHLTAFAFAGAAVLLLPAAASVSSVVSGLGPFDTPFESSKTVRNNQFLAADAPNITKTVQRLELQTPPGDALLGTDTSGLAENFILYSGREVLPIGGYLGNVPAPTLAALQADISRGYVRVFVLPVSPSGPDPRVRWIESHCTEELPPPPAQPVQEQQPASSDAPLQPAADPPPAPQLAGPVRELPLRTARRPAGRLNAALIEAPPARFETRAPGRPDCQETVMYSRIPA